MDDILCECLQVSLIAIGSEQRDDGGFYSKTSANQKTFEPFQYFPTLFTTALISQCLAEVDVDIAVKIGKKSATYLYENKSEYWSWNYWQKSGAETMRVFPDDLDDTVCSIDAINKFRPELIDGRSTGALAKLLINSETKLGGPYETWLVPSSALNKWHNIDLAVNANILNLLSNLEAVPKPLVEYVKSQVAENQIKSSYYTDKELILYFIARAKISKLNELIKPIIEKALHKEVKNPLAYCALISAAVYVGCEKQLVYQNLLNLVDQYEPYKEYPIYVEPPEGSIKKYAGSAALSASFFCEAIAITVAYKEPVTCKPVGAENPIFKRCLKDAKTELSDKEFLKYETVIALIASNDHDGKITSTISALAHELGVRNERSVMQLQMANLTGWVAYTIYDNVLDRDTDVTDLCVANFAMRRCTKHFRQALPNHDKFNSFIEHVLNQVDRATFEEIHATRLDVRNSNIAIYELPNYKKYGCLAMKSWGHVLATTGVFLLADYSLKSKEVKLWQKHIFHLLIARQLSDDAHDWKDDLLKGRLNSVSTLQLARYETPITISIEGDLPRLSKEYWIDTIEKVNKMILEHVQISVDALERCNLEDEMYLRPLLKLKESVQVTINKRRDTLEFIETYKA